MQVAEEAGRAAVGQDVGEHRGLVGLGEAALHLDRVAVLVEHAEVLAVEVEVRGVLAHEHRVGLRARGDQDGARGQRGLCELVPHAVAVGALQRCLEPGRGAALVHFDGERRDAFGKANALFQRLLHFLVVERIRGAVDQAAAIGDRDPAPVVQQLRDPRRPSRALRGCAFGAQRARMVEELLRDLGLLEAPRRFHRIAALLFLQRFVTREELLHLHRVVRERLGCRVDGGQPAADHDHRQAHLHVGDRVALGRPGELQRHQEVRRRTHAVGESVGQVEHRRLARARRERDVVEAQRERAGVVERAAEAHAAVHREAVAALEQEPDHLEEVLVPAHRDAVLGHTPEARHQAVVERLDQRAHVAYRCERHALAAARDARQRGIERLDLEAVDADDRVAVVDEVVRERESGGAHTDDQHPLAGARGRHRLAQVERVPARE